MDEKKWMKKQKNEKSSDEVSPGTDLARAVETRIVWMIWILANVCKWEFIFPGRIFLLLRGIDENESNSELRVWFGDFVGVSKREAHGAD